MSFKFSAIILTAGFSSRMGEFKPLLLVGGKTILEYSIELLLSAGIQDIKVVTGYRAEELKGALQALNISYINNPEYKDGMFTSIKAGVASVDCGAFFILPVDIPFIRKSTLLSLIDAYREGSGEIIYPVFNGKRGHPPLISGKYKNDILSYNGNGGLAGFLKLHDDKAREIRVADEGILLDCDDTEDYNYLVRRNEFRDIPTIAECRELYKIYNVDDNIAAHCIKVAGIAYYIGKALSMMEYELKLAAAAGMLHDIARKEHRHAEAGAEIMEKLGYPGIASVVKSHMDIEIDKKNSRLDVSQIVYIADKLIIGSDIIDFEERVKDKINNEDDPHVKNVIKTRLHNALLIKARIEKKTGRSLDDIITEYKKNYNNDIFIETW